MAGKSDVIEAAEPAKAGPQKVDKWAAIAGRWKFSKKEATYLGPDESFKGGMPLGIVLGSQRLRDGTIKTTIKLKRNENTSAGIVIRFQSLIARYLTVQLGGWNRAYAIGEYLPEIGWVPLSTAGSLSNLSVDQPYELRVRLAGQTVEMTVDDIAVLRHVLIDPLEGTGFGLNTWGDAPVDFSETTVNRVKSKLFVIMPFREPFETLYRDVILPVAEDVGFDVVKVDEIFTPGVILNDIQQQIEQAQAVVAEISTQNPNVFYELGYAHALKKPAVLLVRRQEGADMPFDVRSYRAIFYDDSIGGKKTVETNLRQHFAAILRDS